MLPARLKRHPLVQELAARLFPLTGHHCPGRFYNPYKVKQLTRAMSASFSPLALPTGYGRWLDERIVEYPWFLSRLPSGPGKLLDAGSVLNFDFMLQQPRIREKDLTIMTLAPETECFWRYGVSYVFGDLRATSFRENYFDYVVSISTVEHIGLDNTLLYTSDRSKKENDLCSFQNAIRELRRVLQPGGAFFVTVPYGKRDVRKWLQIFDQEMVEAIVAAFAPAQHSVEYFRYSSETGWRLSSAQDAADSRYFDPLTDTPWPGAPVAAEAIACLELRK